MYMHVHIHMHVRIHMEHLLEVLLQHGGLYLYMYMDYAYVYVYVYVHLLEVLLQHGGLYLAKVLVSLAVVPRDRVLLCLSDRARRALLKVTEHGRDRLDPRVVEADLYMYMYMYMYMEHGRDRLDPRVVEVVGSK